MAKLWPGVSVDQYLFRIYSGRQSLIGHQFSLSQPQTQPAVFAGPFWRMALVYRRRGIPLPDDVYDRHAAFCIFQFRTNAQAGTQREFLISL